MIKLDVSFHINALNGFPGAYVKYVNECLDPKMVIKMMDGKQDRFCYWIDTLAFYRPGKSIKVFTSREKGMVAKKVSGENGWGMDKIFIPEGVKKTKAELTNKQRIETSNREHWDKLIQFVNK